MIKKGLLKGHARALNFILRLFDLLLVLLCGVLSYYYSTAYEVNTALGIYSFPEHYFKVVLFVSFSSVLLFPIFNVYRVWRGSSTLTEIKQVTIAWLMMGLLLTGVAFATKSGADFSRSWMGLWLVSTWVSLVGLRILLRVVLRWLRSSGFNHRHIVIVGTGDQAVVVADRLRRSTWFGLEISALFGAEAAQLPTWLSGKKIISDVSELRDYVDDGDVDQVWISLPHSEEVTIRNVILALDGSSVQIRYVPDIFEYQLMHHSLSEIAGVPVVNISYSAIDGINEFIKTCEDYLLAAVLLVLASPLMLLIALGVKMSSSGPVLYRQKRVGWNERVFTMYKFRSMPVETEKESGPVWSSKVDNRATRFGSFLRKTSLDELPQLFNVLQGKMSLVGPRPERPMFVEKYKNEVLHYMKKHLVKAGVTGWAQVHGWRGNTCLHTRIEHDLYYIENWSLWLDIKIFIMTVFRGFINKNAY